MSVLMQKGQEFVNRLKEMVNVRDPSISVQAELAGNTMKVLLLRDDQVVDSYNLIENIDGTVECIRDWNGVL